MAGVRRVFAYPQINWFPGHMFKSQKEIFKRLDQVDLFLEVRDARVPYSSANSLSQAISARKKSLILLNKSDLCSLQYTRKIMEQMKRQGQNVMMFSAMSRHNLGAVLKYAGEVAPPKFKTVGTWMMVGGIPNTGKSSIINTFRQRSKDLTNSTSHLESIAKVGPKPGVTKSLEGFKVSTDPIIYVLDSPGVMSPKIEDAESGMKLALTGALKDGLVDPEVVCDYLFFVLNRLGCHLYVEKYKLEGPTENTDFILKRLEHSYNWSRSAVCDAVLSHYREGKLGKVTLDKLKLITYHPATHDTDDLGSGNLNVSFGEDGQKSHEGLSTVPSTQRIFRPQSMWRRAFFKIKSQRALEKITEEIVTYGTNELLSDNRHYKDNIDALLDRKVQKREAFRALAMEEREKARASRWLLHPTSWFKKVWNLLLTIMLIYTAIIVPYRLAFEEPQYWDFWTAFEFVVDGFFLLDIVVTMFSSYYRDSDGTLVQNRRKIIIGYLKSWFIIDILSSFPFSLLDYLLTGGGSTKDYNTTARLTRLPRLYKLIRISRIAKAFKYYNNTDFLSKIQDYLHINSRIYKLVKFLVMVSVAVHIIACLWFFSWRLDDFSTKSWVVRNEYSNSPSDEQYLAAVYWAVTTVVTVGYGDISAKTEFEQLIAILWMIVGVGFYSFTIGSLSSFLTSIDTRESVMTSKMAAIQEFANETGISQAIKAKIRSAIRYHSWKTGSIWSDKHSLFNELPKHLQYEVAESMYSNAVADLPFFSSRNQPFLIYFMPLFKPMRFLDSEFIYRQCDHADEVLFIIKGRVNLVLSYNDIVYKSYVRRSYFGDIEVVKRISRIDNVKTCGECEFLSVSKADFLQALEEFPGEAKKIKEIADERLKRHREAMLQTYDIIRVKLGSGKFRDYKERERLINFIDSDSTDVPSLEKINGKMFGLEGEVKELKGVLDTLKVTFKSVAHEIKERAKKFPRSNTR